MTQDETIVAIATPHGAGGVGIVRVSGPRVRSIAHTLTGKTPQARKIYFCAFRDGAGAMLDRGLAVFFAAPKSFTGEDVLELHAHGSPVVLNLLLRRACELGARQARAGEFSERAFLNGKLDLTQTEAVADLIAAGSEASARAALRSLEGDFSKSVHALFEVLVNLRAWLEAALDFPEEEIDFLSAPQLADGLHHLQTQLVDLLAAARRGVVLRDGLHVVIVGRPNAGKSSLLNALAQSERAIVTDIAGTTRDVLRETVSFDGIALTLADTAGLRESGDAIEAEGMRRARGELAGADVAILVTESTHAQNDMTLLDTCAPGVAHIVVHNKIDLSGGIVRAEMWQNEETHIWLSVRTGAGLDLLREELKRLAGHDASAQGAFSARTRHVQALETTGGHVRAAQTHLQQRTGELAAEELRQAQQALGEITGQFSSDDLLGKIFSTFCIGK